jgi:predicted nucleic acid-binding protein
MEVRFTPEQEAQLTQAAVEAGTDAEHLVKDAALRLLGSSDASQSAPPGSVVAELRALRARVKPDPEGWTTRDYVRFGRR